MLTVWSPAEPEICAFFVENTFDEGIRFHPRPNELVQLTPLGRSETFCFAHCKTNAFNERGLPAAS